MKKILSVILASVLLCAAAAVVCSAEDTQNWIVGNGYNIVVPTDEENGKMEVEKNSPVTVTENADGTVKVSHGGYYQDGENWGGVASKKTYTVDGLSVTVKFDKVPEVADGTDCWAYIGVLEKPQMFKVGKVPENRGFMNLIRFSRDSWEFYNGIKDFSMLDSAQGNGAFALKSGDVVTVTFNKTESGRYVMTLDNNGKKVTHETEVPLESAFADGKAHVVVSASCIGSAAGAFEYTITNIKDGEVKDHLAKYRTNDPEPGAIKVYVDGERLSFDQPPVILEGRTLVPLRAIFEALGAFVEWDDATKTVTAVLDNDLVKLTIGSKELYKNDEVVAELDVPAQIVGGRTLVPARAVAEAYNAVVQWVQETKSVVIFK